ncbi:MAG: M20/M25/M40 family metallo-hydrolase [Sphingomicrobium sp.]
MRKSILTLALLLLCLAFKSVLLDPPQPPAQPAAGSFDTDRAAARLQRVLGDQRPHPVDSPADDAVRDRLMAELRAIGLEPSIQEAMDCSAMPKSRGVSCSRVRNVIATIGDGPGKHLLLNAHYDSTPTGPGAADDGVGVASMLEIASLLKTSPPARPVTFLFNEGEEFGLNGAAAFVREHPLASRVDTLINIEARGVTGPALMFETSDPNGAAIAIFGGAAARPYANSLSMDFAKLIPNTTDVVEFRPKGWTMLNVAIIGNETRYHTPGDTLAALDRASLYHVGSEVLAMTRAISGTASPPAGSGRAVFTDIAGRLFISLPLPVAAVALGLMVLLALVLAYRRKALGRALGLVAAMAGGGIAAAGLASLGAGTIRASDFYRAYPLIAYLAVYATMLWAMLAIFSRYRGSHSRAQSLAASWLLTLLLGGGLSLFVPGASIFFLFALALALAGIGLANRSPPASRVLLIAAALVQLLMFAQLLALIELLLIDGPLWAGTPLAALAVLPFLIEMDDHAPRPVLLALAVTAIGLWVAALVAPRASAERPAAFTIDYFRNHKGDKTYWTVASKQAPLPATFPGKWSRKVLDYSSRTRWASAAPMLDVPAPRLRFLRSMQAGQGRRVWLALSSGGGNAVAIRFAKQTKIVALGLPGSPLPLPAKGEPEKAALRCSGRSCEGLVIEALFADREPVVAELFASRFALPPEGATLAALRPATAHPQYGPDSSVRMKTVRF